MTTSSLPHGARAFDLEQDRAVVWAVAARIVGEGEADDIVQETFLRALLSPPADVDAPLRPWLITVARRVAIDWLRKHGRVDLTDAQDFADGEGDVSADPPHVALQELLAGLGSLTRGEVVVLLLRDALDLAVDEVAALLETGVGSVRVLHHKARRKAAAGAASGASVAGIDALDHFLTWLLAHAAKGSALLLRGGVIEAQARLLDAIVGVSAGRPAVEARARLSRGTARRLTAPEAAVEDLAQALALGADAALAGTRLAEGLFWLGRHAGARQAALAVVNQPDADAALRARAHGLLASLCLMGVDKDSAKYHVDAARAAGGLVESANASAIEHLLAARYDEARNDLLAALAGCRVHGGQQETSILINLGVACTELARLDEAEQWLLHALDLVRERGDAGRESTALGNLALVARHQGRLADAGVGFEKAIALARATHRPVFVELWRMNLAIVDLLRGRVREGLGVLQQVEQRFISLGAASDALTARLWCLAAQAELGLTPADALMQFGIHAAAQHKATLGAAAAVLAGADPSATGDGAERTAAQLVRARAARTAR